MPCAYVSHENPTVGEPLSGIRWLADAAVRALVEEADLTPKPVWWTREVLARMPT